MDIQSTISAFRQVLSNHRFGAGKDFPETFAIARFQKKFQQPDSDLSSALEKECWEEWINNDEGLPPIHMPPGVWYKARALLQSIKPCSFKGELSFPVGSEFYPTRGLNSIQSRLSRSRWSVTRDAFEDFSSIVYNHKALKRAFRHRYNQWFRKQGFDLAQHEADSFLFRKFSSYGNRAPFHIFQWKLERVVSFVNGSRFATIPKNNTSRRPINVEPFGNVLVQRAIGVHLRQELSRVFGIDLLTLQDLHREKISLKENATIDLSNASDSISNALVEFLFPKSLNRQIQRARSHFILGQDGIYHLPKKVSSMGNGFTFELMSMILTAVCKCLDPNATVFGDDIIVSKHVALDVINSLHSVGLKVNTEKSFIDGPFRESCGGNYHDDFGYIESFDFEWPENIHDCMVLLNKARYLPYGSFQKLAERLQRCMPKAFCSGLEPVKPTGFVLAATTPNLDSYFRTKILNLDQGSFIFSKDTLKVVQRAKARFQYTEEPYFFLGVDYCPVERTKMLSKLRASNWSKYEMYLNAGRRTPDVITGRGSFKTIVYVRFGEAVFRLRQLKQEDRRIARSERIT